MSVKYLQKNNLNLSLFQSNIEGGFEKFKNLEKNK